MLLLCSMSCWNKKHLDKEQDVELCRPLILWKSFLDSHIQNPVRVKTYAQLLPTLPSVGIPSLIFFNKKCLTFIKNIKTLHLKSNLKVGFSITVRCIFFFFSHEIAIGFLVYVASICVGFYHFMMRWKEWGKQSRDLWEEFWREVKSILWCGGKFSFASFVFIETLSSVANV